MIAVVCSTQAELDAAVAAGATPVELVGRGSFALRADATSELITQGTSAPVISTLDTSAPVISTQDSQGIAA